MKVLLNFKTEEDKTAFFNKIDEIVAPVRNQNRTCAMISEVLRSAVINPDQEKLGYVFVAGKQIAHGLMSEMRPLFDREVVSHSASVQLKEKHQNQFKTVLARNQR